MEESINSHIFQKSSILRPIATDNKLYALKYKSHFYYDEMISYKFEHIKNILSYRGFCNEHDTKIFKPIEVDPVDWNSKQAQQLLCYRSLCREIYEKRKVCKVYRQLIEAAKDKQHPVVQKCGFNEWNDSIYIAIVEEYRKLYSQNTQSEYFDKHPLTHKTLKLPYKLDLCISAIFSIDDIYLLYIVNVFPYKNETIIIIGYDEVKDDQTWADRFVKQISSNDSQLVAQELCDLLMRTDFHCMSKELYEAVGSKKINNFIDDWTKNIDNRSLNLKSEVNLFTSIIDNLKHTNK